MRRNERKEVLKAAGIETGSFAAFDVPEGATIIIATKDGQRIEVDRNGNPISKPINAAIKKRIYDIGFIKEDPAYRRWVTAQTFEILNSGMSYERYINHLKGGYYYQFDMLERELEQISKLSGEAREMRLKFFNDRVVIKLCEDYMKNLRKFVDSLPEKSHRGIPYKRIPRFGDCHTKDIEGRLYAPLEAPLMKIKDFHLYRPDYRRLLCFFREFKKNMIKIYFDTQLCPEWLSAYQGNGAYYTMMNLIKWHGCRVFYSACYDKRAFNLEESINAVDQKANAILKKNYWFSSPEWYKLTGMLKELIEDNKFDFKKRMKEIYG